MQLKEHSQAKRVDNLAIIKKYLFLVLRYWWLIVAGLVIGLSYAYFQNKYTTRVYPVSVSLLVDGNRSTENSAALLYNNPIVKATPNYYNEPYLLKSEPLMLKVVEKLKLHISYHLEGDILTTELYPGLPLEIKSLEGNTFPYGQKYLLQLIDANHFKIKPKQEDVKAFNNRDAVYTYGELLNLDGFSFSLNKKPNFQYQKFFDQPFILNVSNPHSVAENYSRSLNVSWMEQGAGILNIKINGSTPAKEIDFLNELASTYIREKLEQKSENATKTIDFIGEQLVEIADSLDQIEAKLELFKRNNFSPALSDQGVGLHNRLQGLESEKINHLLKLNYLDYLEKYIQEENSFTGMVVPAALGIEDPLLSSLITQLIELQLKRDQLGRTTNFQNPNLEEFTARIDDIKRNVTENIKSQKKAMAQQESVLDGKVRELESKINVLPTTERKFINIKRIYNLSEELYVYLMQKKAEASISKASTTSDIEVLNPAKQLGGSITPNIKNNYMMAILFGLGLPLGFVLLKDYLNDKIKFKEDLKGLTSIPLIGVIGHIERGSNLVVFDRPKSAVSESFRAVRSNLQFFTVQKNEQANRTYLITSSISGEGKTFCSMNLATVFAFSGKKTLLIGADMRKPKIYQDFELSNEKGLSNFLANSAKLEEIIQVTKIENLDFISSGLIPPNPSELLMSIKMQETMHTLQELYDIIVIDTPPIGLVTDALGLMKYADHTLYLIRQNYTSMNLIKNLQDQYSVGSIKNISILYNDLKTSSHYGYGYGYDYGYGSGYYDDNMPKKKKGLWSSLKNSKG